MLTGEKVRLRAVAAADVPVLWGELRNDVELVMRSGSHAWAPKSPERFEADFKASLEREPDARVVNFAVDEISTGELAGEAQIWGIDTYNRRAHLGFTLREAFRGRGLGRDVIDVLCDFAFRVRGLHSLAVETLADNEAARRASEAVGFVVQGQLHESAWVSGEFVDELLLGLLARDWFARRKGS